jgi:hypothetical protein
MREKIEVAAPHQITLSDSPPNLLSSVPRAVKQKTRKQRNNIVFLETLPHH